MRWKDWLTRHSAYNHRCKDPSAVLGDQIRYHKLAIDIQQRHRRLPGHLGLYTFNAVGVSYLFTCQSQGAVQRVVDEPGTQLLILIYNYRYPLVSSRKQAINLA